jgi:hypothetical protein
MTLRRVLGITAIALVILAAVHVAAWFHIADRLEEGIHRWAAERRAEGWTVSYGDFAVDGFPFAWRARLPAPRLQRTADEPAFLWSGPSLDLTWRPWQANSVGFRSAGQHWLGLGAAGAAEPVRLDMADARGRLAFDAGGQLQRLALDIQDATITPPSGDGLRLDRLAATLDAAPAAGGATGNSGHLQPSLRVDGELTGLTLPETPRPALGRTIGVIAVRGAVLGSLPAARLRDALDRWRAAGGTLELERLDLGWSALTVRAEGTLALDADLQPVGAMTAQISGFNETADALLAAGLVKPGEALVAKVALGALARTPKGGGQPQIEMPLAIQEGWLFVGPVRLIPVPPVRWE